MAETQEKLDSLLTEVNALATEAVNDIAGDDPVSAIISPPLIGQPATHEPSQTDRSRAVSGDAAGPPSSPRKHLPSRKEDPKRILNLEVPVIVQLAERTLSLSEIVNLTSGAIIEFEKSADSPLDLMINNKCIGRGQAVKVGENFGLRLTTIGSLQDRIKALGNR